ncbi:MAG: hypothetical protein JST10_02780 [Bacteroidetes bacterium]|nr:hypothetical protein [Bacteroidota bacterium]
MLTALTKSGRKVTATEAITFGGDYYCPGCKEPVILRNGYVKEEHFAHHANTFCTYSGESVLHRKMKSQIYSNLQETIRGKVKAIEMEKPLLGCRPDIFVEGTRESIAIEVQTSSLTAEEILRRTEQYCGLGIYVLWVIPFERDRVYKYDPLSKKYELDSIRLKEYERVMSALYFKSLVLWDVKRPSSEALLF